MNQLLIKIYLYDKVVLINLILRNVSKTIQIKSAHLKTELKNREFAENMREHYQTYWEIQIQKTFPNTNYIDAIL